MRKIDNQRGAPLPARERILLTAHELFYREGIRATGIDRVIAEIERMGNQAHLSRGQFRTVIGAVGEEGSLDQAHLASLDGVEKVVPIMKPYKLASREFHEDDTIVEIGGGKTPKVRVGGPHAMCIAGPCAVENEEMLGKIARQVRDGGATVLRGGVFKPRTSPYSFQGLGLTALKWMRDTGDELGMPICVEVMDTRLSRSGSVGIVKWRWVLTTQAGVPVLDLIATSLFQMREPTDV